MVIWDTSLPLSWSAGFLNKVAIPCPRNSSFDFLACCVSSSMSLDLVTNCEEPARKLAARGQPAYWGIFRSGPSSCQDHLSWGPTYPSKFPKGAPAAPVLGNWIKESIFGIQRAPYIRVSRSGVYSQKLYFFSGWGFCSPGISQFVLYLSGVPRWRGKRVVGLLPDLWPGSCFYGCYTCVCHLCFVCLEFLSVKMGNVSTIAKESSLRWILDKWFDSSHELMSEKKMLFYCNNVWSPYLSGSPKRFRQGYLGTLCTMYCCPCCVNYVFCGLLCHWYM